MRKSRFMEEQITYALRLADSGKKRVYRLYCQEGPQLRMKVKRRKRIALLRGRPQVLTGPNPHSSIGFCPGPDARRTSISHPHGH